MKKKIAWSETNYDMGFDTGTVTIEQETGNKGFGLIVAVMCGAAILLPVYFTIMQIVNGTASGNPVGAVIAVVLILGWPVYWGIKQFFQRRIITLQADRIDITYISLFNKKKESIKLDDYENLVSGRTASLSTHSFEGAIGSTGYYYFHLRHPNKRYAFDIYRSVQGPLSDERVLWYCERFHLDHVANPV